MKKDNFTTAEVRDRIKRQLFNDTGDWPTISDQEAYWNKDCDDRCRYNETGEIGNQIPTETYDHYWEAPIGRECCPNCTEIDQSIKEKHPFA